MPVENEEPTLADLLVPSILEKNPQRFDRPWKPDWIVAIALTAGPAVAGFFAAYNRDRLDRHRHGFGGVILGALIQILSILPFLAFSVRVVAPRNKGFDDSPSFAVDLFGLFVIYLIVFCYSAAIVALQQPRYQLYRSMKLPSAASLIPGFICFFAIVLTIFWLGMAFLIGLQAP